MADPVMSTAEPGFKVREHQMDNRQVFFGNLWVAALGDGQMLESALFEFAVAAPIIRNNRHPLIYRVFHEAAQRFCATIRHHGKPDATGVASVPALVQRRFNLPLFNLDRARNQHLVMNPAPFAACPAANPSLIRFNMLTFNTNQILIGAHHARPQLVQYLKGRFIARQPELPLELHRRHACGLAGNQISRPEPYLQRRVRFLHNGTNRQPCIAETLAASHYARTLGKSKRSSYGSAGRANKAVWETQLQQVGYT